MVSFRARAILALSAVVTALLSRGAAAQASICVDDEVGDSICDAEFNIAECSYDNGDCCASTCEGDGCGRTGYDCQDPDVTEGSTSDCDARVVGDASCDPAYNNALCSYDGGDCCASTCDDTDVEGDCGFSGYDCQDPGADENAGLCLSAGDSTCNEANNTEACNYDDGDCCESTCQGVACGMGGYDCQDPGADENADPLCPNGEAVCDDPHMQGLRGQRIDWSGVDGGWYALIHGGDVDINVRLTAPLPDEFPDRQLVTGLSVLSQGHALTVEVKNPYDITTDGCPDGVSPCLADGGLRIIVDEEKVENTLLLRTSSRELPVADGAFLLSASNLPVECRQFGGDKIWARMYDEWMRGTRDLASGDISFEAWMTSFDRMAAPDWCVKYIAENDLIDLQSTHAIFKIETSTGVTVRLNAGVNSQGGGERDWDERVLPDLEFWQMGVGVDGLEIEDPALSGILGETARPVFDENGKAVMEGFEAFRGIVEDYRVSSALGSRFALLDTAEGRFE